MEERVHVLEQVVAEQDAPFSQSPNHHLLVGPLLLAVARAVLLDEFVLQAVLPEEAAVKVCWLFWPLALSV